MLVTEQKPWEEISSFLRPGERIFVLGCDGCAAAAGSGGKEEVGRLADLLSEEGWEVTGKSVIEFLCNKALVGIKLSRMSSAIEDSDSLLVATCGVGVQSVAKVVDKQVHPANDTVSMGDFHGTWPSEETCEQCGECLLEYTGGLCPLTVCTKDLLNGPCGGSYEGECEVEEGRPCGWELIYQRLKEVDRLDLLANYNEPKPRKKYEFDTPMERRRSLYWAIEAEGND